MHELEWTMILLPVTNWMSVSESGMQAGAGCTNREFKELNFKWFKWNGMMDIFFWNQFLSLLFDFR